MGMTAARQRERRQRAIAAAPRTVEPKNISDAERLAAARVEIRQLKEKIGELEAKNAAPVAAPERPPQPVHTQARPQQTQKLRRG